MIIIIDNYQHWQADLYRISKNKEIMRKDFCEFIFSGTFHFHSLTNSHLCRSSTHIRSMLVISLRSAISLQLNESECFCRTSGELKKRGDQKSVWKKQKSQLQTWKTHLETQSVKPIFSIHDNIVDDLGYKKSRKDAFVNHAKVPLNRYFMYFSLHSYLSVSRKSNSIPRMDEPWSTNRRFKLSGFSHEMTICWRKSLNHHCRTEH